MDVPKQLKLSAISAISSVSLLLMLLFSIQSSAQQTKVLWIGNSYVATNNLPLMFYNLALSGGDTVVYDANTPGGYTLMQHASNATTIQKIQAQSWDYVILQAQSQEPSFPPNQVNANTFPYARVLDSLITTANPCTETVFYMTWGRKYGDSQNCPNYPPLCTFEGMNNRLRSSYKTMADNNNALMAPAGMAWKNSWFADSTINLWVSDNSHPAVAGSYLTACVFYSTLFRKSPVGLSYTGGLNAQTAAFLQQTAWTTVSDSLETWNIGRFDPKANFTFAQNEAEVTFSNTSTQANSYAWNFGDGLNAADLNPIHTYTAPGSYQVSLVASNGCGRADTAFSEVTISTTSIKESAQTVNWRVFPNPSNRDVMIQAEEATTFRIEVYGPDGKLVKQRNETGKLIRLDFSDLPAGIYQVYCFSGSDSRVFRLMKE